MKKYLRYTLSWLAMLLGISLSAQSDPDLKVYSNYDFIPGEKILFEDDFFDATDGEFPPRWKLLERQGVVNRIADEKAFVFMDCSMGSMGKVEPRIKTKNYLGESFTVEFDFFLPEEESIALSFRDNTEEPHFFSIQASDATLKTNYFPNEIELSGKFKDLETLNGNWYHAAFAYKNKQIKCYINESRVLVVPDCGFVPLSLYMMGSLNVKFRNFKLADGGGMNMLNKIITDGKFVSRAIKFDVGKATLKGESMGFITELANWMKQNPTIKLEIGGHTDSDGNDDSNLKLSAQRAAAVKKALVSLGVGADRLQEKGYGETQPLSPNTTPEGKADNRRVEFKKI